MMALPQEIKTIAEAESPRPRQAGHIKDARGRRVKQLDPLAMYLLHQHGVIEADVLRAIAHEQGIRMTRKERAALLLGISAALLVMTLFTHSVLTGDISGGPFARSAGLIYLCSIPWIVWYNLKRFRFGRVAAAMLKYLRCPHCGYDLRRLPADPSDGVTICPECGCAWHLRSIAEEPA